MGVSLSEAGCGIILADAVCGGVFGLDGGSSSVSRILLGRVEDRLRLVIEFHRGLEFSSPPAHVVTVLGEKQCWLQFGLLASHCVTKDCACEFWEIEVKES